MLTPRIHFKRAVAALLPLSLLWVFAACISICAWESSAAAGRPDAASTVAVTLAKDAAGCEDCPEASFLKATTPERTTFKHGLRAASDAPASSLSVTAATVAVTLFPPYRRQLLPDLPLKRLPALRI
jgi:hypothetical protein